MPNDPDGAGLPDTEGTPDENEALNTPGAANKAAVDTQAPEVICQDITVQLSLEGSVTIDAASVDGGSTDDSGIESLSIDIDTFTLNNLGENVVTLTATDLSGNSASCEAIVTIIPNENNPCPNVLSDSSNTIVVTNKT